MRSRRRRQAANGGSSDALRAKLAGRFRQDTGRTPGASSLADTLNVLTGEALDAEAEPVHLRDLEPIPEASRRTEQEMEAIFAQRRGRTFGGLLDALAAVLANMPKVQPGRLPRMADFGCVLAAADAAGVTDGALDQFRGQQGRIAAEVIDADPFRLALVEFVCAPGEWQGTATELLTALLPESGAKLPHGWPRRNGVAGRVKRLIPALAAEGIVVEIPTSRTKWGRIIKLENRSERSSPLSPLSPALPNTRGNGDDG